MKNKLSRYALLSVYDKKGIAEFASQLHKLGFKILSTGGTAKELSSNGIPVIPIEEITGNPEIFDGRMKTISFQIESGILFDRSKKTHQTEAAKRNIPEIEIVVCNFYPFDRVVNQSTKIETAIEQIDVGGPTMVRAAAKNYKHVYAVFDPADYERVLYDLRQHSKNTGLRKELSAKAFSYLSWYDSHIAQYLNSQIKSKKQGKTFQEYFPLNGKKMGELRYGDNPHQKAAWYTLPYSNSPFTHLQKISGRELSVTNLTDINAGLESVRLFSEPAAVVIKHNSPCGIALGKTPNEALSRAIEADPVSAFGGVVVINKPLDLPTAQMLEKFKKSNRCQMDIVAAPKIDLSAQHLLTELRKTTGLYTFGKIPNKRIPEFQIRWIDGGYALQTLHNEDDVDPKLWQVVTKRKPTHTQRKQLEVAWKFVSRIKSNSVIVVDRQLSMTRGIGSGQTSRIGSAQIALNQANKYTEGAILASDAFLPFTDIVELAVQFKIGAIIQSGGSIRDKESIDVCDRFGISMIFTGKRVFWH